MSGAVRPWPRDEITSALSALAEELDRRASAPAK
jgi:hypothetical protein